MADGCGLSVAYLHRILRAGGTSAEAFIFEERLERCRELLLNPLHRHRSIAELAYQAGFRILALQPAVQAPFRHDAAGLAGPV